jgi:hypothetical protein
MRGRKPYLFFLADRNGLTYYVQASLVLKDNNPTPLPNAPIGWMEEGVTFVRNSTYNGINRAFSGPLKFISDGATIIRHLFYTQRGIEQDLFFIIVKWNDLNDTYEVDYKGELDLTTFNDSAAEGVEVNSIEGGLLKLLKAYDSVVYQFPLDGTIPENIKVNIDGILFQDKFTYSIIDQSGLHGPNALGLSFDFNTGDNIGIEKGGQNGEPITGTGTFADYAANSSNYLFSSVGPTSLNVQGQLSVKNIANQFHDNVTICFYTSMNQEFDIANEALNTGQSKVYNFNFTINLAANEKLFLLFYSAGALNLFLINQTDFTIQFASKFPATQAWCMTAADVFKLLVQQITGRLYPSVSNVLDQYKNLVLTSGDALRAWSYVNTPGVAAQPIVLKTSLRDFWDSLNPILNAALGNETIDGQDTLFFEDKRFVFDPTNIDYDLDEVSELKISYATDHIFNTVKIGYPEQQYDQQSGKQEYNITHQYKAPITKEQKELTLVTKYRADSRGIEFTRFNSSQGTSSTNNASDNSVFILNVDTDSLEYEAIKNFNQDVNPSGYAVFDTFLGNGYTVSDDKTQVTYTGNLAQEASINVSMDATGGSNQVVLKINGISVRDKSGAGLVNFIANVYLNPGDVLSVQVINLTGGLSTIISGALIINLTKAIIYNLKRVNYDAISGLDNPSTAYNIEDLTPTRMLYKWGNYLRSILYSFPNDLLTFQTGDKNYLLSTTLGNKTIFEGGDINIGSLDNPLFFPLYFTFKTQVPDNFTQLLSGTANGHIKFSYNGKSFYGFPVEVKQQFALNPSQTWKLLASPLNNLADLQDLDVDGLNYLDMAGFSTFIPELCPVKFVPLNNILPAQYHFRHMDGWWFSEQVQFYLDSRNYFQKWQQNDIINLQCMTNGLGPVQVQFYDSNGKVVLTDSLTSTADPAVKAPYILYQKSFGLGAFAEGVYYIVITAGTGGTITQFISEGLFIKADWPETLLFEYSNSRNKQSTIFTSGWSGSIRAEGWLDGFTPNAHFSTYEDQPADVVIINGIPYRTHQLNIGNQWDATPPWLIDKLSRIILLDNVLCDGLGITRNGDKEFSRIDIPGVARKFWTLEIREAKNRDGITLSTDGALDANVTVEYNINTKGFGIGDNGDNVVIIQTID